MSLNTAAYAQFQSIQGPTDPNLTHTLTEGYQPVSRIGEVVINAGEVVVSSCGNSVFQYYEYYEYTITQTQHTPTHAAAANARSSSGCVTLSLIDAQTLSTVRMSLGTRLSSRTRSKRQPPLRWPVGWSHVDSSKSC